MPDEEEYSSQYSSWGGTNNVLIPSDNNVEYKTNAGGWSGNGQPSAYKYSSPNINRGIYDSDDYDEFSCPAESHPYGPEMDFLGSPHDVRTIRLINQLNKIRSQQIDPKWNSLKPGVDFGKTVQKELKKFQKWSGAMPADGTFNPDTEQKIALYIQNSSYNIDPVDAYIMDNIDKIGNTLSGIASIINEIGEGLVSIAAPTEKVRSSLEYVVKDMAIRQAKMREMRFSILKDDLELILKRIDNLNDPNTPFNQENLIEGGKLNLRKESTISEMRKLNPEAEITIKKVWDNFKAEDIARIKVDGPKGMEGGGLSFNSTKLEVRGDFFEVKKYSFDYLPETKLGRALKTAGNVVAVWIIGDIVWKSYLLCTSDSSNMGNRANDLKHTSFDAIVAVAVPTVAFKAVTSVAAETLTVLSKAWIGTGIGVMYALVDFGFYKATGTSLSSHIGNYLINCFDSFSLQKLGESFEKNDFIHRVM